MKNIVCYLLIFVSFSKSFCQLKNFTFDKIETLQKVKEKNVVVFFHTNWCKYCRAMHKNTFKNEAVIKTLNDDFYFIDFDAEQKTDVFFNNKIFGFKSNGLSSGTHEIAIALATVDKQLHYPTLCVLNSKNEIIFRYNGFLTANKLLVVLKKLKLSQ